MPNPFDWRGPDFLVFYVALGIVVTLAIVLLRHRLEPAADVAAPLTDYLKIAYLRGGAEEALRVATVALIDRGLVELVDSNHVKTAAVTLPAGLQRTEQRMLETCKDSTRASAIVDDTSLKIAVTTECEGQLIRAGLLADEKIKADRQWLLLMGLLVLGLVALVKILIAFSRGRTNVLFLIAAVFVFGFVLSRVANPARTLAGDTMLADLRQLFSALRDRTGSISSPSDAHEMALLAAVFGLGALPFGHGSLVQRLFQKPQPASSSSSGSSSSGSSSCGSSGGSSCGSSGGSSCGSSGGSSCGGGCGGGGCGGCGS